MLDVLAIVGVALAIAIYGGFCRIGYALMRQDGYSRRKSTLVALVFPLVLLAESLMIDYHP